MAFPYPEFSRSQPGSREPVIRVVGRCPPPSSVILKRSAAPLLLQFFGHPGYAAAALGCGSDAEEPTELSFVGTVKDANALRPGQFLIYKGVRISEVTAADLAGDIIKVTPSNPMRTTRARSIAKPRSGSSSSVS